MSMARYISMAVESAVRASACTACLAVQRAETVVTVRLQRAHAEFLGQGKGVPIVGLGLLDLRRLAPCGDVAEQAQGIRLVATFLVLTGERQRMLGEGCASSRRPARRCASLSER